MDFSAEFPILRENIYFNHAGVCPIPARAAAALAEYAHQAAHHGGAVWPQWNRKLIQAREHAAALLGAATDEIAFIRSTTHGLTLVAQSLPWHPGENVICLADDFPANVYPWKALLARGVQRRTVAPDALGRYTLDDFAAQIDSRTRLVAVSLVHYASGYRLPVEQIAELCHSRGVLLCLDGIQGLGALPVTVDSLGCDFIAADGHKWLLGPEGLGILYIRRTLLDQLDTTLTGWLNRERPADYADVDQPLADAARRYEDGAPNMAAAVAWEQSLALFRELTLPTVWNHIEQLTATLAEGAQRLGFEIHSPRADGQRSGILRIAKPGLDPEAAVKQLAARNIHLAARGGGIRLAPHFYNTPEQCAQCLAALGEISRTAA